MIFPQSWQGLHRSIFDVLSALVRLQLLQLDTGLAVASSQLRQVLEDLHADVQVQEFFSNLLIELHASVFRPRLG